jgi:hypothetical protein
MYQLEKNTAEKPVATREAKTWKSHVNAIIRHVHSHFGGSRLIVPLTWPADNDGYGGAVTRDVAPSRGELIVKFPRQSLSLLLSCCLVLASAPGGFAAQAVQSAALPPTQGPQQSPVQDAQRRNSCSNSPRRWVGVGSWIAFEDGRGCYTKCLE